MGDEAGGSDGPCGGSAAKRQRVYSEEEVQRLVAEAREQGRAEAEASAGRRQGPAAEDDMWRSHDPVHGEMLLPAIVRQVIDTALFQRLRNIKQVGMCSYVYIGAAHDRFSHSIGTAHLAYKLVTTLQRQSGLKCSHRDVLCIVIGALCHDLGHPCYSHSFEVFMHTLGKRERERLANEAKNCVAREARVQKVQALETWVHETASIRLLDMLFESLKQDFHEAGLRVDAEGDDFQFIREIIEPPKKQMTDHHERGDLKQSWSEIIKGRPVEKAWLYEIVSNWRSGIDVDKFDYYRRDAYFLGIKREFDHDRYIVNAKVVPDHQDIATIAPPYKDKDAVRDMLETRKALHQLAYQHKTTKKMEGHLIDILMEMEEHVQITGEHGRKMSLSEAAIDCDPIAYPKLTDMFIESLLVGREVPGLEIACDWWHERIVKRRLMRLVGSWDLPLIGEASSARAGPMPPPREEAVMDEVLRFYNSAALPAGHDLRRVDGKPSREVPEHELRVRVVTLHCGMKEQDPITRVVFHDKKSTRVKALGACHDDVQPLRHKVFLFWNPPLSGPPADDGTIKRLYHAFTLWSEGYLKKHEEEAMRTMTPPSISKAIMTNGAERVSPKRLDRNFLDDSTVQDLCNGAKQATPAPKLPTTAKGGKRMLRVQTSAVPDDPVP